MNCIYVLGVAFGNARAPCHMLDGDKSKLTLYHLRRVHNAAFIILRADLVGIKYWSIWFLYRLSL